MGRGVGALKKRRPGGQDPTILLSPEQLCFQMPFTWSLCLDTEKGSHYSVNMRHFPAPPTTPTPGPVEAEPKRLPRAQREEAHVGNRPPCFTRDTLGAIHGPTAKFREELGQPALSTAAWEERVTTPSPSGHVQSLGPRDSPPAGLQVPQQAVSCRHSPERESMKAKRAWSEKVGLPAPFPCLTLPWNPEVPQNRAWKPPAWSHPSFYTSKNGVAEKGRGLSRPQSQSGE